jgi:hypothetical protein
MDAPMTVLHVSGDFFFCFSKKKLSCEISEHSLLTKFRPLFGF